MSLDIEQTIINQRAKREKKSTVVCPVTLLLTINIIITLVGIWLLCKENAINSMEISHQIAILAQQLH